MSVKYWSDLSQDEKISRWENVHRVLANLPEHTKQKHWDMRTWGEETICGTVACAAGHCGMDPWFREQGLSLVQHKDSKDYYLSVDVGDFFGYTGARIFWDTYPRPVEKVLFEIEEYLLFLKGKA